MRRRIHISVLVVLAVLGSGAQWDALQVFAWTRMALAYAAAMPAEAALKRTFSGEMCNLCRVVADAKQQEQPQANAPAGKLDTKILLFFQVPTPVVIAAPRVGTARPQDTSAQALDRLAPPLPPPRLAQV